MGEIECVSSTIGDYDMRTLAFNEIHLVAGGMEEVVVSAKRPSSGNPVDPFGTGFNPQDIYGEGEGGNEPEQDGTGMPYEACVAVFGIWGHHLGDKYGQKIAAQIMSRILAAAGFVVGGPAGAVVGGVVGYGAGHEWGEKHGSTYGAAVGAVLIGGAVCPR